MRFDGVEPARAPYAAFPEVVDRDWIGRWCHLSEADLGLIRRHRSDATRLGFATQLVTVRAIGTFLSDPAAVPKPVVESVSSQLAIGDPALLIGYSKMPVRWRHSTDIRERYGYQDFSEPGVRSRFDRWLYRIVWTDDIGPSSLFEMAHRQLLADRIVLPGQQVLVRAIGALRERSTRRLWSRVSALVTVDHGASLNELLVVPEGRRNSGLDRLRRSPVNPTVEGLVKALGRLEEVRSLGLTEIDLSRLPRRRVAALARYGEDAWVSQLVDLAPERRTATLVAFVHTLGESARDDVVDVFDRVFGDMQRSAHNRGQQRRVAELRTYDRAVGEIRTALDQLLSVIDDPDQVAEAVGQLRRDRDRLGGAIQTVDDLWRPPGDPFHDRLVAAYAQIRRFLPQFMKSITLASTDQSTHVLEALEVLEEWFDTQPRTSRRQIEELPTGVVTATWEPYVIDPDTGLVDRAAYTCCVLDQLRAGLRRRDIYIEGSLRWGDPRAELIADELWDEQRDQACAGLALDPDADNVISRLSQALDGAWRRLEEGMDTSEEFRIENRDGKDRIVITPLDAIEQPASLIELRANVEALLPQVEIADLPAEVHAWTGMLDEYTHISGADTKTKDLHRSISALLVADACNVGLTPVVDEHDPALTRERLNWVAQNYVRSATHARANARLFDYHAELPLAQQAWGGGEMASADGMRLVIPVSTVHAGYNPRYFGRQRGSTLYTWMADTHASFHQTLIPGTHRDSLYALDGLLANPTTIKPETVSTDTAGASEIVFALAWTLGYRFAPRLADLADHRVWRIDRTADYGQLNGLARNHINTKLIASQWDQICRLTASLEARTVTPSAILRTLQRGPNPSTLTRALVELGRVIKTLHILNYCDDPTYRRDIGRILNRGESRNGLARDTFHGSRGELRQRYQTGQENQLGALGLMVNIIVLWQTVYIESALDHLHAEGHEIDPADVARLSPLGHPTINLKGRYRTTSRPPTNNLRPLRTT